MFEYSTHARAWTLTRTNKCRVTVRISAVTCLSEQVTADYEVDKKTCVLTVDGERIAVAHAYDELHALLYAPEPA